MAKRKNVVRRRTKAAPGPVRRIRVPQPDFRPVHLRARDVVRGELIQPDSELVLHRRGILRPWVGADQDEARAVPASQVKGTLLERIIYKALVDLFHFVPGADFDFQSSLEGGRQELGGIVADFLFPYLRIVLNPAGPTHKEFLRSRKDDEQIDTLAEMGYTVFMIDQDMIMKRPAELEQYLRAIFLSSKGSSGDDRVDRVNENDLTLLSDSLHTLYNSLESFVNG